ncbi:MAG: hypothetical protein ACREL6_04290 [Gemmatimonadales bacterium]
MRAAALVILLLVSASELTAQDPRLEGRLSAAGGQAVAAILDTARAESLPSDQLVLKTLEGLSKGAAEPRIIAVVHGLMINLRDARTTLGVRASEAELGAAAAALRAGVRPDALKRLQASRPEGSLLVPLGVLSDLVAGGVPAETAESRVLELAREGGSDADFVTLRENLPAAPLPAGNPSGVP